MINPNNHSIDNPYSFRGVDYSSARDCIFAQKYFKEGTIRENPPRVQTNPLFILNTK